MTKRIANYGETLVIDMYSNCALRKSITWPNLTGSYPGNCAITAITATLSRRSLSC